ncbi:FAD-dependent oxidoreductase [Thiohalobacter sp. IOR34]|uniref:FAD-dependent oxidoreductase n=1 Tax=Thiohalobacter sp. IOR34 TaxID=3057176 RepID=UPI0025B2576E|nr:FAD-dependent oxidoreductase [Thiohalobacter sp. IOR34]WJW76502.1 FAD-dependent oxidoreductase [Thiohalobacter sp. IOR34]
MARQTEQVIQHWPRAFEATRQDLMPARYGLPVQLLSMAAFTLAFFGWLNESWLFWFDNPIWLNRYTEYALIFAFGLWRIAAERNTYTRRRLIILVTMVTAFWWLIPWLAPVYEPYVGYLWAQPVFPSLHVPGTVTFFLVLAAVFLFGRRIICGFNCPCVGIRETVGFAFRDRTLRSKWTWRLRHSKWFFFLYYVGVMVVTQFPPSAWTVSFVGGFYLLVGLTYFGTFFVAPLVGNRFYCRYLCPYGATFGLLNHAGFYRLHMDQDRCIDCRRCEQVCDMGIPVWEQGREAGRVTALEDCMGCARCVVSCPTDALEIRDVRNLFRPALKQNASHLLKREPRPLPARREPPVRPASQRLQDWGETVQVPSLAGIQAQAARCLDCGVPGCVNACPLHNRIPEWLEAVARGEIEHAAEIAHATSSLPEVCGTLCPQHRLCEGACTLADTAAGPVTIGAVERFLVDEAASRGWRPSGAQRRLDRKAAMIGAGPAGLACADVLSRAGWAVTVFDRATQIGGLLASGVPPFKLDKALLERRRRWLEGQGVRFRPGTEISEADVWRLLTEQDALFLGIGAQTGRPLVLPGRELAGVEEALDYLRRANAGAHDEMRGRRVLVIGGGDTAMDCARSALRQGAAAVTVVYRRDEAAMRASPKERRAAAEEGVRFLFQRVPEAVLGEAAVTGMRFLRAEGSVEKLDCDRVILAVGQVNAPPDWLEALGVALDERGRIRVDTEGRTDHPKIYAGGDDTLGPDLVVTAVAAGRRAAQAILHDHRRLRLRAS